jgi:hypothetical protein
MLPIPEKRWDSSWERIESILRFLLIKGRSIGGRKVKDVIFDRFQ